MKTEIVPDEIEMTKWSREEHLLRLRCHSDAGSQFTSIRCGEHLIDIGAVPSIGSVGDSFHNDSVETVNVCRKAELFRRPQHPGSWKTNEELAAAPYAEDRQA